MATKKNQKATKPAARAAAPATRKAPAVREDLSFDDLTRILGEGFAEEDADAQLAGFLAPEPGALVGFEYDRRIETTDKKTGQPKTWHVAKLVTAAPLVSDGEAVEGQPGDVIGVGSLACIRRQLDDAQRGDTVLVLFGEKKRLAGGRAMHTAERISVRRKHRAAPVNTRQNEDDDTPF